MSTIHDLSPDSSAGVSSTEFTALGLIPALVTSLAALGYEEPTPIQRKAIPPLLEGRDLLGQAATGTGKTAAFALPMLQRIVPSTPPSPGKKRGTPGLILVPTRELAMQVAEAVHRYGRELGASVLPIYGGQAIQQQLRALRRGVDVVVATPGRALDHLRRRTLDLESVRVVVLDEADEMLDMGFAEDLEAILEATPATRQTALFSATIPPRIAEIAKRHLRDPVRIRIARDAAAAGTMPRMRQVAYVVQRAHKVAALGRVLDIEAPSAALVFCRTRTEVDELAETLNSRGYRAESLHGGMSQEQRDRVMKRFRAESTDLLIATDVAARGLDIEHLSHVVNFDVPSAADAYVHRIGRTGRAGREGVAITLIEPREHRLLRNIEQYTKQKIEVATVPTGADLRARKLELTRASIREALMSDQLEHFRVVVQSLASEFDVLDVAAAAVKLAHDAAAGRRDGEGMGEGDEEGQREADDKEKSLTLAPLRRNRGSPVGRSARGGRYARGDHEAHGAPDDHISSGDRGERTGRGHHGGARRRARGERERPKSPVEWEVTRLYIGAGRRAGVRPADLVGAIANETGLNARAIGAIEITDGFSLVEVPEETADEIIGVLRATTIKGKRVVIRRNREAKQGS